MVEDLLAFFSHSQSAFHVTAHIRSALLSHGYAELSLTAPFPAPLPPRAFVVRDEMTIVAFSIGAGDSAIILSTDVDAPFLRPRPHSAYAHGSHHFVILEQTGGRAQDIRSYADQVLTVAGAVFLRRNGQITRKLICAEGIATLPMVPDAAREVNSFPALIGKRSLLSVVAGLCGCEEAAIVDWDLRFVPADPPRVLGSAVHATAAAELAAAWGIVEAFLRKSEDSGGVKMMALYAGGMTRKWTRDGPGSDLLGAVAGAIFADLPAAKLNSLNVVVETLISDKLDKTAKPTEGPALRTGVRSDATTELIGRMVVETIARNAGVKLPASAYGNNFLGPPSIGPKLLDTTDIRTVQLGQFVIAQGAVRSGVKIKEWKNLVTLLTALYNDYDRVKAVVQ
jgi:aspartyl aminopeptidase